VTAAVRPPLRPAVRAADYAWIVAAQLRAAVRPPDPAAWWAGDRVPVILLPGVYETWGVLTDLARALHAAGHPVGTVPTLGRNAAGLVESAGLVGDRLRQLGADQVLLVAHSKGGLIGRLLLADPVAGAPILGMVALNTPFAGSGLARWFPARAIRELAPDHPQLRAAAAERAVPARIVSLYAPFDPHVPEGSVLPGARNVPLPVDGHFSPLGDARVHRLVVANLDWLAGGRAGRPGPD
jgi:hypothetical protein